MVEHQRRKGPLHPFDPPQVKRDENVLTLSHFCCHMYHPGRVTVMVRVALQADFQGRGYSSAEARELAEAALQALAGANRVRLRAFVEAAEQAEAAGEPGASILAAAARRHAWIIATVLGGSADAPAG